MYDKLIKMVAPFLVFCLPYIIHGFLQGFAL